MTPVPSRTPRRARTGDDAGPSAMAAPAGLVELGLAVGDRVRFRRRGSQRWIEGVVSGRERDGSVALTDARGASRSIAIEHLEIRTTGPRGGTVWEPLTQRAARTEQLRLL